jgi:hypothetical protein
VRVRYGQSTAEHEVTAGQPLTLSSGASGLVLK